MNIYHYLISPRLAYNLALFRIVFGLIMVTDMIHWLTSQLIYAEFIYPKFFFSYIDLIKPLPTPLMTMVFYLLLISAIGIGLGLFYRFFAIIFFILITYVFLIDKTLYLNHMYLICLISGLLCLTPTNRIWSLDTYFFGNNKNNLVPNWTVLIFKFQIFIVYFFGALAKINYDWLNGHPLKEWIENFIDLGHYQYLLYTPYSIAFLAYGGIFVDLLTPILLCFKQTFIYGAIIALTFHFCNAHMFNIGVFPYLMSGTLVLFIDPSIIEQLINKITIISKRIIPNSFNLDQNYNVANSKPEQSIYTSKILIAFMTIYVLLQLLLPIRRFFYPGNTSWSEYGHRYSWSMMLRQKYGKFTMWAINPDNSLKQTVNIYKYLTVRQATKMMTQPDLIIQFAKYYANLIKQQTGLKPIIKVEAKVSLNGRPYQDLIDSNVDLTTQPDSLFPVPWILPLKEESLH